MTRHNLRIISIIGSLTLVTIPTLWLLHKSTLDRPVPDNVPDAICLRDTDYIADALKRGLDPNREFGDGWAAGFTPLTLALTFPDCKESLSLALVRQLVDAGADINRSASKFGGTTPLIEAVRTLDIPIVRYLIEQGADVNAADVSNRTALMSVSDNNGDEPREIVVMLLKAGADQAIKSNSGMTASIWFSQLKRPDIVKVLELNRKEAP